MNKDVVAFLAIVKSILNISNEEVFLIVEKIKNYSNKELINYLYNI